jgi:hypothetical protein
MSRPGPASRNHKKGPLRGNLTAAPGRPAPRTGGAVNRWLSLGPVRYMSVTTATRNPATPLDDTRRQARLRRARRAASRSDPELAAEIRATTGKVASPQWETLIHYAVATTATPIPAGAARWQARAATAQQTARLRGLAHALASACTPGGTGSRAAGSATPPQPSAPGGCAAATCCRCPNSPRSPGCPQTRRCPGTAERTAEDGIAAGRPRPPVTSVNAPADTLGTDPNIPSGLPMEIPGV